MSANPIGTSTSDARTISAAYWPTRPSVRRPDDLPMVAAVSPRSGAPSTPSPGRVGGASSGGGSATSTATSAGIVHPALEDDELHRRDGQRDEEQPHRVHGADAYVVGPDQP